MYCRVRACLVLHKVLTRCIHTRAPIPTHDMRRYRREPQSKTCPLRQFYSFSSSAASSRASSSRKPAPCVNSIASRVLYPSLRASRSRKPAPGARPHAPAPPAAHLCSKAAVRLARGRASVSVLLKKRTQTTCRTSCARRHRLLGLSPPPDARLLGLGLGRLLSVGVYRGLCWPHGIACWPHILPAGGARARRYCRRPSWPMQGGPWT